VETPAQHLSEFVSDTFPSATLPPERFENLPYLRFELGENSTSCIAFPLVRSRSTCRAPFSRRKRRVEQAVSRGGDPAWPPRIPRRVLWPADDLAHEPDAKSQLLRLLPAAAQSSLSSNEVLALWPKDEDDEDDHEVAIVRLTVPLELRRLDYRALFRLIAHDELGLEPRIGARVYLVDETDPLVF
jgi:hypothetical protein